MLEEQVKSLPSSPGIYQYFNKNNHLLYVGKAKNLKHRVKSYFQFTPTLAPSKRLSFRIHHMIEQAVSLNYIVVDSENDALILENSLIKQLKPKYNILLRDDKTYPYIYLDRSEKYPRFDITRKVIKAKDIAYFGPYSVGARDILDSLYEICKLVQKKSCLKGGKACLFYQMKQCLAPCEFSVTKEQYQKVLDEALEYIHHPNRLIDALEKKMLFYAEELRFEEAGVLRDRVDRIKRSKMNSNIDLASKENYDIFAISFNEKRAAIVRMFMRDGKIISSTHQSLNLQSYQIEHGFDIEEAYERAIIDFYGVEKPPIVSPILTAHTFENSSLVEDHLTHLFEKKAHITTPQRGDKKKLTQLALKNADEVLRYVPQNYDNNPIKIKALCELENIPNRVEVFDNSHMAGRATVGAMVVYENGVFKKSDYRLYHLEAKDEYAQMRETLTRRVESFGKNPAPDLWLIDGGKTLVSLARDIIESSGTFVDVIGISKEKIDAKSHRATRSHRAKGSANDIIHTFNEEIKLKNSDVRLHWLQKLRDEAHRSAISFHQKTKLKEDKASQLLTLKGISQAKIVKLLKHFTTFENLKSVSEEEIASILNKKDAKTIKEIYH